MGYWVLFCVWCGCANGEKGAQEEDSLRLRDLGLEFVWIESGVFRMGTSPAQEEYLRGQQMWDDLSKTEQPVREVVIEEGFYLGKYEITQAQWAAVTGTWPWLQQEHVVVELDRPAVFVSWRDAQQFIQHLNIWAGEERFRLPTETEWEYAWRAGSDGLWSFGDDKGRLREYACYKDNTWDAGKKYAQAVGGKKANAWGLHDMYGNVWEWCEDWAALWDGGGYKPALRGGSFFNEAANVRSALRIRNDAKFKFSDIGLRVVRIK